ncbi:AAA-binding protein [Burkholderia phage vB_BpP_HN05]
MSEVAESPLSLYQNGTADQVYNDLIRVLRANRVAMIHGSPGIGKSAIGHKAAAECNLLMIDHRMSTSRPEDMTGLPHITNGRSSFNPFADLFPLEGDPLPEGYDGWLLFLDEFNSAHKSVQAAAYKLILDRMVGQHKLHPNVRIVCAGNLATDRAIVNDMGTAMQSRLVHLEMRVDFESWLKNVAIPFKYDSRIVAYLSRYNGKLYDFRPDHNEKTFCCPRTWEFVNDLIKDEPVLDMAKDARLLAGTITSGVATDFIEFTKVFENLPSLEEVETDPSNAKMASDTGTKWAITAWLSEKADDKNFGAITEYMDRMDTTFKILFYRMIVLRQPGLKMHPAFSKALSTIGKYLWGNF